MTTNSPSKDKFREMNHVRFKKDELKREDILGIIYLISKPKKSLIDSHTIANFLSEFGSLVDFLSEISKNYTQLLYSISISINYQKCIVNETIFRIGDPMTNFYIILEGSVTLLVSQIKKVEMTMDDYCFHMKKLFKRDETYLLNKNMEINKIYIKNEDLMLEDRHEYYSSKTMYTIKPHPKSKNLVKTDDETTTVQEYLENIKLKVSGKSKKEKLNFLIAEYHIAGILKQGSYFGDKLMCDNFQKRTLTVISNTTTHLATLEKKFFNELALDKNNNKVSNIAFLMKTELFKNFKPEVFVSQYFSHFMETKVTNTQFLFKEGDPWEFVYFIKNGDFELSAKINLRDINRALKKMNYKLLDNELDEYINLDLINDISNKKFPFKIGDFKGCQIFCLDNTILDETNLFSLKCLSEKGSALKINKDGLNLILNHEPVLKKNIELIVSTQNSNLGKRLKLIKKQILKNYTKEKEIKFLVGLANKDLKKPLKFNFDEESMKATSKIRRTNPSSKEKTISLVNSHLESQETTCSTSLFNVSKRRDLKRKFISTQVSQSKIPFHQTIIEENLKKTDSTRNRNSESLKCTGKIQNFDDQKFLKFNSNKSLKFGSFCQYYTNRPYTPKDSFGTPFNVKIKDMLVIDNFNKLFNTNNYFFRNFNSKNLKKKDSKKKNKNKDEVYKANSVLFVSTGENLKINEKIINVDILKDSNTLSFSKNLF